MKWIVGSLLVLLIALILDSGLLAFAMYVLLGVLLVSRWLARGWMDSVSVQRSVAVRRANPADRDEEPADDPDAHEARRPETLHLEIGDRVRLRLVIANNGWMPIPWILLEDTLPPGALDLRFPRFKLQGKQVRLAMIRSRGEFVLRYSLECLRRGYYQIGPLLLETGDLFGLHRRHQVQTQPIYLLVYPRVVPLEGFDIASRRPIGDVRLTHRLYEDPTRIVGVRRYEAGDPLNKIHWRATARTGQLHTKMTEPSTLAGATIMLDFHQAGYPERGEPFRSELAVTVAMSLASAIHELGQQVGLVTNGRDAADRLQTEQADREAADRLSAHEAVTMREKSERLQPLAVETRRGSEQLHRIRDLLARVELTDGLTFAQLSQEVLARLPRDASVIAVLPQVDVDTALTLGNLRRRGFAVSAVLILLDEQEIDRAYARLTGEGIRDLRHVKSEEEVPDLCGRQASRMTPYTFA